MVGLGEGEGGEEGRVEEAGEGDVDRVLVRGVVDL